MGKQLFKSLIILGIFFVFGFTQAQKTITGTVSDADGPLPGAAVIVQGTDNGVTTVFDGNYSIEANEGDVLEFSFIGMTTATATVGADSVINITLMTSENRLEEVVVVGYSAQTRGDITGSVASVDIEEALKQPVANAAEVLQGRVSGVNVISNGAPGAAPQITIRGLGTSNNTNPLYIIDGVQTDDPNILNSIDPSDIVQMNVLKDGAAAIYGARASNGVIIVKTKSGGYSSKATLSVDAWTGMSQVANKLDLMGTNEHGQMIFDSRRNDGSPVEHPQYGSGATPVTPTQLINVREPATVVQPNGTDWQDAITRTAPTSSVTVSASNGNENGQYFMSVGYFNRDGVLKYTGFERVTTRLNSEFKVIDGRVRVGEHLNVAWSNGNGGNGEAYENSFRSSPLVPTVDDNGLFAGTYNAAAGLSNTRNPLAQLSRGQDDFNKSLRVFGDIYIEIDIWDKLKFRSTYGVSLNNFDRRTFTALDPEFSEPLAVNQLNIEDQYSSEWNWSNVLSYDNSFGDHNVSAILGVEAVKGQGQGKGVTRADYLFEDPDFYNLSNGAGNPNVSYTYENEFSLFSYFLSANYNYKNKYFLTATLRNDESSRFLGDNKSQFFPSVSAGWLMSSEDWFNNDGAVSRLKFKASWGQLGNQTLPAANPTQNISALSEEYANYNLGGSINTGAKLNQVGNPNLKWETSETINFGIEAGFLQDRLYLDLEFYQINTEDLVTRDNSLISTTAIDAQAPLVNLGDVKNTGVDVAIGWRDETDSGFKYSIDANLSHYKNEVTSLISDFQSGSDVFRGGPITRTQVGEPISFFYGRNVIGLDENGRFDYEDVNGDGVINDDDRRKIGSPHPDFTYGINVAMAFKGFDLSLFFNGSQGNDIYNYNKIYTHFPTFFNSNRSIDLVNSWTPDNTNTNLPALSETIQNSETNPNSFFVEDGSFFRLKNLQFGYTFKDLGPLSTFRIYLQGTNLFTITDYSGLDPEVRGQVNSDGTFDNLTRGVDWQLYPISSIYTIGVNLKF
jgi:TonB-linked SusC/RagA family outer membrane protein